MATGKAIDEKPYAGNPHVRFDGGRAASAATPRRGSLLYRTICGTILAVGGRRGGGNDGLSAAVSRIAVSVKEDV